jgi:hypothetical protein
MGYGGADGFHSDKNSGGTITGGGTLNYIAMYTPIGSVIGNSIMSQDALATEVQIAGNFVPDSTIGARTLGKATSRWDTLYLASNIDYATDLKFNSGGSQRFRMSTTGNFFIGDNRNIDVEAVGAQILNLGVNNAIVINIGTGLTPKTINVGSMTTLLDNINIYGNIFSQQVTNLLVKDKLFTVNDGGAVASGFNAGFEIDEGGISTGFFMTNATRDGWDFKAPAIAGIANLSLALLTGNHTYTLQDASGTLAFLSDITGLNAFVQNGNSFGALATLGTNDAFGLAFETNNTERARFLSSGEFGVGISAPIGRMNVFGMVSGINQRLEPVAGVTEDVSGATIPTVGAATVTLQTIAIPLNTVYMIEARITARKTAGIGVGAIGDGNGYIRTACYANIAGVVTLSGALQTSFTGEGITAFNATFTISGTDVLVRVTGAANDNVTWNTITRIEKVA